ncbi:uncharacterized protein ColSpa_11038 [Colletotrichum spaethianum]|uniref:Uncharacterized protein n=1 Tax=Colletotrichum spaethianum TaxID=700344 RepID=A0AA37PER1_9PEZI|nr:uncharacterized protein ColSpa_11038 [Colletotrichum spaethianum]GKT50857.1 hypothetical protein ColSpa_11038 [Colletotrichum spaethianum]
MKLPWCLVESGYVEIGDWAQVSWSRFVDLEALEFLLDNHLAACGLHRNYPAAFSTFLVRQTGETTKPQNAFLVCKTLVEHGFAGPADRNKQPTAQGMSPSQILSEGAMDSALTQSSTIEWLRSNMVFSEEELHELEDAFPLDKTSPFVSPEDENGKKRKRSFF